MLFHYLEHTMGIRVLGLGFHWIGNYILFYFFSNNILFFI